MDPMANVLAHVLSAMFAVGVAGCVVVVPVVAYQLFRVWFQPDSEEDEGPAAA